MGSDDYDTWMRGGKLMKATALLLILCFQVNARGQFQDRVTLRIKDGSLETVLKEIRKQTGYLYALQDQWKLKAQPIDISVTNATVEEVLDICFRNQPFTYKIIRKTIVVEEKTDAGEKKDNPAVINPPSDGISGTVRNEDGAPLAGATIEIKKLNKKGLANDKGEFLLTGVPNGKYEVVVTFIGYEKYQTEVVVVDNRLVLPVSLKHVTGSLDEVQIIAYGTTTKRLNTGDVTTVKAADIETQPVSNPLLALEGRVPGMFITQVTGLPGSGVQIQLRGLNSISNGYDPLFIVDGVPFSSESIPNINNYILGSSNQSAGNPLNYINPADIESIDVLKDADATAIYGSRGANGVVLITTKKGKAGQPKIDVNVQNGSGKVAHKMKVLNLRQYLDIRYEAFRNDGATPNPNADYDLTLWDTTRSTDWQKELIGGTAQYTDAEASISGGSTSTQYLIGGGYNRQTTVFPGDFSAPRGSVHFNINTATPNEKLKVLLSGIYTIGITSLPVLDFTQQALLLAPDAPPIYNSDGSLNWAPGPSGTTSWPRINPAANLLARSRNKTANLVSNAVISYRLLPGLDIKSSFGYTSTQSSEVESSPLTSYDPATWSVVQRQSSFVTGNIESWIVEPQITYIRSIGKSAVTALIGTTIEQSNENSLWQAASGFNSDLVLNDLQAATSILVNSDVSSVYKYNALFGRLTYDWENRYLLDLTARRDGSSRFGPDNQFHDFGAVGAGWIFSREKFIKDAVPILSYGKLRGSYGTTGSDQIGDYTFMDLYNSLPNIGVPYQGATGTVPTTIYTPNLAWEETRKGEGGIELGFLHDRIFASGSYYRNRSSNQLVPYSLPLITGFTSVEKNLNAIVQNTGWEFEVKTVNIKSKEFSWTSSFNLTINRNKLASGAAGLSAFLEQKVGYPLVSSFAYHFLGVNPITGINQFAGSHGAPTARPDPSTDMNVLIDPSPKIYGGFQNSIGYKGFQLDFLFQFMRRLQVPVYLYNYMPGYFSTLSSGSNQPIGVLKRWQKPGDVTSCERFSQNFSLLNAFTNAQQSDHVYGNGSYIRLKNVSLSWQLPPKWRQSIHLQNARLYIQGQNLLTFTKYQGLDPESASSSVLPPLRVITAGIQVTM